MKRITELKLNSRVKKMWSNYLISAPIINNSCSKQYFLDFALCSTQMTFLNFFEVSSPYQWITGNQKRKPISRSYPYLLRILTSFWGMQGTHPKLVESTFLAVFSLFCCFDTFIFNFSSKNQKKVFKKCFKLLFKAGR